MNHHKIAALVVIVGGGYELYNDYTQAGSTVDYVIDGAIFLAGCMLFFKD